LQNIVFFSFLVRNEVFVSLVFNLYIKFLDNLFFYYLKLQKFFHFGFLLYLISSIAITSY